MCPGSGGGSKQGESFVNCLRMAVAGFPGSGKGKVPLLSWCVTASQLLQVMVPSAVSSTKGQLPALLS
jgi:hypothetical protein